MSKKLNTIIIFIIFGWCSLAAQTSITGTVFNDGNNSGVKDATEVGYPYVVVNAYAPGATIPTATATTLATPSASIGQYTLSGLTTGVKYRLEFINPNDYYNGGFASGSKSSVQFATPGATNINFGFRYAGICIPETNPRIITGVSTHPYNQPGLYFEGLKSMRLNDAVPKAFVYNVIDPHVANQIGFAPNVGGIKKKTKKLFFSALNCLSMSYKSNVQSGGQTYGFAPGFTSTNTKNKVYVADYSGSNYTYLGYKTLVDLSTLGIDLSCQYPISTYSSDSSWSISGIGGSTISTDENTLYLVNAGNGKIIKMDITNVNYASLPTTAPTASDVSEIAIPSSVTNPINGRFRPYSLKIKGNKLYIGGVTDGSLGGTLSDLRFMILAMDLTTEAFSVAFQTNPNFKIGTNGEFAKVWSDSGYVGIHNVSIGRQQYQITSFDFDDQGNLIFGVNDRNPFDYKEFVLDAGLVFKATLNSSGGYDLENNGIAGAYTTTILEYCLCLGNPNYGSTNVGNYYYTNNADQGPGGNYFFAQGTLALDPQTYTGGLLNIQGKNMIAEGQFHAHRPDRVGLSFLNPQTGQAPTGSSWHQYDKSQVLGGIEAVCDINPIEVGNLVWKDVNSNGIQDGDEPALVGVTVGLYDSANVLISTAVTDVNGNYIFFICYRDEHI